MIILMTFLEKNIENFASNNNTLGEQKSTYHVFFYFLKMALQSRHSTRF